MVQNVWYLNGPPSRVTLTFEYHTPILFGIQKNPVFRWLLFIESGVSVNSNQFLCISMSVDGFCT